jgi:hypothetical protein
MSFPAEDPIRDCPFWDWDAAVLARNLERMGAAGRRAAIARMPRLLGHDDERVRAFARDALRDWGEPAVLAEVLALLDEPRAEGAAAARELLGTLDLDRLEEMARAVLHSAAPSPARLAWALDAVGEVFPAEEEEASLLDLLARCGQFASEIRCALARLAARWEHPRAAELLPQFLCDPDTSVQLEALRGLESGREFTVETGTLEHLLGSPCAAVRAAAAAVFVQRGGDARRLAPLAEDPDGGVRAALAAVLTVRDPAGALLARLQADLHPRVRAAAMTTQHASEVLRAPEGESSWHVLARAARLARVSLWKIEPDPPWHPEPAPAAAVEPLRPLRPAPPNARLLGPDRVAVAPLGISGHYGLPVEGFVRAVEAGVNLLFWEPSYGTLTAFASRLSPSERRALHFLGGTFEADGARVRKDAERALRLLGIERLAVYLVFWVQSWARVSDDVREALERLKAQGKVAAFGLSTHSRPLALEAIGAGWDPLMVRHSAAHRGAEKDLFPQAAARGTPLLTFSTTCYGRLLQPRPGLAPPTAADCYRYALEQPAVAACFSAPATLAQLNENLAALRDPALPDDRRQALLAQGGALYEDETIFRRLVRSR